jgi:hypothetical protein
MLTAVKRAPAAAALAAILALAACGGGSSGDEVVQERASQAISDLEDALAARDFRRVCDEVFSPEGRRRAGGEECQRQLARTSTGVRRPQLELVSARREGGVVVARVRAWAEGERPAIDVVRLVPAGGEYRVESLSGQ